MGRGVLFPSHDHGGVTGELHLSTESGYVTGSRNLSTNTFNLGLGVYLFTHNLQLNVTINNTKLKRVDLNAISGIDFPGFDPGYADMALVSSQEYYYLQVPYIARVTSTSFSVRQYVVSIGNLRVQTSRLVYVKIA